MEKQNLRGTVCELYDTKKVSEKFQKREFVIESKVTGDRGTYTDFIKLQFTMNN